MTGFLIGSLEQPEEVYKIGQQSVRLLLGFGDLIVAWLLARQAEVAGRALDDEDTLTESDRDFYAGKLAAARFFATTVLPRLESDRRIIEETTNDLMELPEGAF
jgi:Acetyl-CoA dehydrogenase C-terminal like